MGTASSTGPESEALGASSARAPAGALEIRDLRVSYRKPGRGSRHEAVRGLSLRVEPGEVVGFIGPNGAGKSSTINALMGFIRPEAGWTALFGTNSLRPESRQHVGYLPEVALYYPWLTARETLHMYAELHGMEERDGRRRAGALLERVGLRGREDERLLGFSKGMLQRVGIAQALLARPKLLILDEVTSGLDPVGRMDVRDILLEQRDAGVTIFFSSHELTEVVQLCDRIVLVNGGRALAEEPLDAVMRRLERWTVCALPPHAALPAHAEAGAPVPGRLVRGRWHGEFGSREERDAAAAALAEAGYTEIEKGRRDGDLEEYFVQVIRGDRSGAQPEQGV